MHARRHDRPIGSLAHFLQGVLRPAHLAALAWLTASTGSLGAAGCAREPEGRAERSPPTRAVEFVDEDVAQAIAGAEAVANVSLLYSYNAVGKRDPFGTYFSELARTETAPRKVTELQRYDLDQLRVVAVVVGIATPRAMVEDPRGRGHQVTIGTLLGKNWGQVKHIRRGEIIIQEEYRDLVGRRITHLVAMKLAADEHIAFD